MKPCCGLSSVRGKMGNLVLNTVLMLQVAVGYVDPLLFVCLKSTTKGFFIKLLYSITYKYK